MMWGYNIGWMNMSLMVLGMTLWVVVLVALGWAVVRWLSNRTTEKASQESTRSVHEPSALEILKQRYARGELDTATFENMRERLEGSHPYEPLQHDQPLMSNR
jgi:putative membrane protein